MAREGSGILLARQSLTNETKRVIWAGVTRMCDLGLQWIQWSGAGSAAINLYATLAGGDDKLKPEDPTTNRYWAPIPPVFAFLPGDGSGRTSDILPIADNAVRFFLVEVIATGTVELEILALSRSRGT